MKITIAKSYGQNFAYFLAKEFKKLILDLIEKYRFYAVCQKIKKDYDVNFEELSENIDIDVIENFRENAFDIVINSSAKINNKCTVDVILRLIDNGTLSAKGLKIVTKAQTYINNNIHKLYEAFILLGGR